MAKIASALHQPPQAGPALPSDTSIANIANLLIEQTHKQKLARAYAPVKEVLSLLGAGAAISAAILLPKSATLIKPLIEQSQDWDRWKHFNASYLQRTLRRLEKEKVVEITEKDGQQIIQLTKNGKRKILKYSVETLAIDVPKHWDGNWRLVLYDIPKHYAYRRDIIRQTLRTLGFYAIQESVFLCPYSCFSQIEFLREYYGLGDELQYMVVSHMENDTAYKTYFNLS